MTASRARPCSKGFGEDLLQRGAQVGVAAGGGELDQDVVIVRRVERVSRAFDGFQNQAQGGAGEVFVGVEGFLVGGLQESEQAQGSVRGKGWRRALPRSIDALEPGGVWRR